ncbi:MAG: SGNH/GDSL hydrolase family protein [Terriglobales bacterium]
MRTNFIVGALLLMSTLASSQVVLQALPPDTPANCEKRSKMMSQWLQDWPNLQRYRHADAELSPPKTGEPRVVFMGDSITDAWDLAKYFPGKSYVNRGISAQTTPQMLLRFRQDVVSLKPRAVIILAGTNDIAGNTGPLSLAEIENNYASMADIARANHIAVIFSSILPINNYTPASQRFFAERSMGKIHELNAWLKNHAQQHGDVYLDYYSQILDDKGLLRRDLAEDGLHPNETGYRIMADLVEKALAKAFNSNR